MPQSPRTVSQPLQVRGEIVAREPVGAYYRLIVRAPGIAARVLPGHFVAVAIGATDTTASALLLRRAFSIHRADRAAETIEIVFAERGAGTRELARCRPGDPLDVVAPLGTPFPVPERPGPAVLVAGGYGSAPLFPLAEALRARGGRVGFVLGAATEARLFGTDLARGLSDHVVVTTDDGSAGEQGRVTGPLPAMIEELGATAVYACGPMAMLSSVTALANEHGADAWTAVEETMACGIGACMSCVLPVTGEDGVPRFVRACVDGPCFDGSKVRWTEVGTLPADLEGADAMGNH